jgi:hypothetical protein
MPKAKPDCTAALSGTSHRQPQLEELEMCYTCGCKLPFEDHGDPANLIEDDLEEAGQTDAIETAGIRAAKLNMLELIMLQQESGELERPKEDYS